MSNYKELSFAIIVVSILFIMLLAILGLVYYIYEKRKRTYVSEQERSRKDFQQTLLQTQIEIQDQTLQTISQEIHDNIGQVLSLAKLTISEVEVQQEKNIIKLSSAEKLLSKAIKDLRDISKSLNSDSIEQIGLIKALQNEIDIINKSEVQFELKISGKSFQLVPQQQLIVFRMIQECINNIIKHSQSLQNTISINSENNSVKIVITDKGKGFNEATIAKGQGLHNITKRANLLNATVNINSLLNTGTSIIITIPISE